VLLEGMGFLFLYRLSSNDARTAPEKLRKGWCRMLLQEVGTICKALVCVCKSRSGTDPDNIAVDMAFFSD
jgi:hypothetical protein